jgi:hypothetical protein
MPHERHLDITQPANARPHSRLNLGLRSVKAVQYSLPVISSVLYGSITSFCYVVLQLPHSN